MRDVGCVPHSVILPLNAKQHLEKRRLAAARSVERIGRETAVEISQTFWVNPLRAGGCVESGVRIYIAGQPMAAVLNLIIASPDNNGDLAVTLIDLTAFAAAYNTPASYSTCHDYNYDCVVSLTDLTIFALYYNISTCL